MREAADTASAPILEINGARATIRLNRPKHLNRLQSEDLGDLVKLFDRIEADPAIRVLVLTGTGVRINAVCPGLIETGMTKPIFDNAKSRGTQDKIGQLNPLKRAGQPHELAAMGLFLASDDASYVNGQAIPVDGGLTASMPYTGKPV